MRPRVAVTGIGLRTPAGAGPKELWNTLLSVEPTARKITSFDTGGLDVDIACQVHDFDPAPYLSEKQARRLDRVAQLAVCAVADAFDDAGDVQTPPRRRAVVAGTGFGGSQTTEITMLAGRHAGRGDPGPLYVPMIMPNSAAAAISIRHQIQGPTMSVSTACASGAHAIGEGARLIRDGSADLVVAGGTEACVNATVLLAFDRCQALSRRTGDPEGAGRPFDADRDGFVLAEGAAFLVLEHFEQAWRRGAYIYAELTGYGRSSDAHHITAPPEEGDGAYWCMHGALTDAGLQPEAIAHVNAHGSGTRLNDLSESRAITRLFGAGAVPVTSTKGVTGHAIGAAGAIEAVASVLSLTELTVPATANLHALDPACAIDAVRYTRPMRPGPVLSNSFGFGGHNASLIFSPV